MIFRRASPTQRAARGQKNPEASFTDVSGFSQRGTIELRYGLLRYGQTIPVAQSRLSGVGSDPQESPGGGGGGEPAMNWKLSR